MQMHEVITPKDSRDFLDLPLEIYKGDKNWIQPLEKDVEDVFDPSKNKFFKQGECVRWLLKDDNGKVKGTVATFINK